MSVRMKLTLSYAGFLFVASVLLLGIVWLFLLRYVPTGNIVGMDGRGPFIPNQGDLIRAFAPRAALVLGFLLLLGLVGGWWLAGRMLAPLTRITDATRRAATGSLSHRIALEGRRDEFRELADSFDAMLARLEAHVAEQQRFAANASHELRTPLAITQAMLEVAGTDPDRDTDELIARLRRVNARAIDLTEALLLLSRAGQRSFVREPVDLSLIAEETAETLLPLAEKHGISLSTTGGIAQTSGSPALLQQLTMNLLHNAVVHNTSDGGTMEVVVGRRDGSVVLSVENTGPELTPALLSTLTEPFRRGTDRIRGDHAGVGLGLAIVKSIVEAHDGTLTMTPRAGGGIRVDVTLPALPNPPRSASGRE